MKHYRRTLAGIAAIAMLLNTTPTVLHGAVYNAVLTVSAAEETSDETITHGDLTLRKYSDHLAVEGCAENAASVEIPSEIDGLPVTEITAQAFANCKSLTSITIPSSVNIVATASLAMLSEQGILTDVFYDGDKESWNAALRNSMGYPPLSAEVHYTQERFTTGVYNYLEYRKIPTISGNTFYINITGCASEYELPYTEVVIPEIINGATVTSIESHVFAEQRGITKVTLPDTITSIDEYAFYNCERLQNINFPKYLMYLGDYAFSGCTSLTSIVMGDNGCDISEGCFAGCTNLKKAVLPQSIGVIEDSAFLDCTSLTAISIPNTLYSIGENAFANCTNLKDVYYACTEEDLNGRETTIGGGNEYFQNAQVHYAEASDDVLDGLHYTIFWDHVEITSADKDITYAEIPASINELPVTAIAASAFKDCTQLESIIIPESVKTIHAEAFSGCTALTSVTIPDSVTQIRDSAFSACTGLTDIVLGKGLTSISHGTFSGCTNLVNVTIPDTVKAINSAAFMRCTSLTEIDLPDTLNYIGHSAFEGCTGITSIQLPNALTGIQDDAFRDCTGLTSIGIPANVDTIGTSAFSGSNISEILVDENNTEYKSIDGVLFNKEGTYLVSYPPAKSGAYTVPEGTVVIDTEAFINAAELTEVILPESLVTIMQHAFDGCTSLTAFHVPATLQSIRGNVFINCENLTTFTVDENSTKFRVSDGMLVNAEMNELLCCPKSRTGVLTIPEDITRIGTEAFGNCEKLTDIILHDGVDKIFGGAFMNCTGLTELILPASARYINNGAFMGCTGLTSMVLPEGMSAIYAFLFKDCTGLKEVTIPRSVKYINQGAFSGCTALETVTYGGTAGSWELVSIDDDQNDAVVNAKLICLAKPVLGDVDSNGIVNATDAAALLLAAANLGSTGATGLTLEEEDNADINGDNKLDASDAAWILQYCAYRGAGGEDDIAAFYEKNAK